MRAFMERRFDTTAPPSVIRPARLPSRPGTRISEPGDASEQEAAALARQATSEVPTGREVITPGSETQASRPRHDFSGVRIHTDEQAGAAARGAVHASAFTVGSHIVFAPGAYAPGTAAGRRLLAHELAHVVQQANAPGQEHGAVFRDASDRGASPEPLDAGAPDEQLRRLQLACIVRLGACNLPGGIPTPEQIQQYNRECREQYPGAPEIQPTPEECRNPPAEPLTTGAKIFLGALLVAGAAAAIAVVAVAGEVIVPIVIAGVESAGAAATGAVAAYYANAIVVNEIGLFAAGLIIGCEGDVPGLLRAIANDPAQALPVLAEIYILHVNIQVAGGPVRKATVPVQLLPVSEQTDPENVRFRSIAAPTVEGTEVTAPPAPPAPAARPAATSSEIPPEPPATVPQPSPAAGATSRPKGQRQPLKTYYGGGAGIRKGMKTTPMADVEEAPPGRPAQPARATLSDPERAMVAEAEQASARLGKPLQIKTKAAAPAGDIARSGYGKEGSADLTRQVLEIGKEIGHDFAKNPSLDAGIPGQSAASHAEKLAGVSNPGKALAVDRAMCPDCFAFFQKYAQARATTVVIHEPGQTWVFRPDGVRVGLTASAQVVLHPGSGASAEPVSGGHAE